MREVWSAGRWTTKPGMADAFVEAWTEFGTWSSEAHGPAHAWLLRDRANADVFMSIGPWPSDEAIANWRADSEFRARIERIRDLIVGFEPMTLDPVAAVGIDLG